jgi:hypothetical protein
MTASARIANFGRSFQSRLGPVRNLMDFLPRDKQIEIIAALTEGMSIRSVERLTGVHRDTVMRLGARVGRGRRVARTGLWTAVRSYDGGARRGGRHPRAGWWRVVWVDREAPDC